jgi:hypothetical protein
MMSAMGLPTYGADERLWRSCSSPISATWSLMGMCGIGFGVSDYGKISDGALMMIHRRHCGSAIAT